MHISTDIIWRKFVMEPVYKRILLKLSGEALAGDKKIGMDFDTINNICRALKNATTQECRLP